MTTKLYNVTELAELLGVNKATIFRQIRAGEIKAIDISTGRGRRNPAYRIPQSEVDSYFERRQVQPGS